MKQSAILFDMDGVLVNSEPVITAAAIAGLKAFGVSAQHDDFLPFTGMGEDCFIGGVSEKYGVPYCLEMKKRVYDIYLDLVKDHLEIYPGTKPLLEKLHLQNRKFALASSADRIKVEANLKVAKIPLSYFSAIITGEDVQSKKPAPDIYLLAAEKIGFLPSQCIVVEDALSGLSAAHAAGMRCIMLPTSFSKESLLRHGADAVCEKIEDVLALMKTIEEKL